MIEVMRSVNGERIWLRSPYDPQTVANAKKVPGANWSKQAEAWTFPLSIETCILLRRYFGTRLRIRRDLADWFRAERARRDALGTLSGAERAELARLPEFAPALAKAMEARPYQPVGARFIAEARSVLIADDPGLGKTLECLGGVVESGVAGPYLVVCPKTAVESVWAREIPRWLPGQTVVTVPDGRATRDAILSEFVLGASGLAGGEFTAAYRPEATWVVVHPEMVRTKSWFVCEECGDKTPYTRKPLDLLKCYHPKNRKTDLVHEHEFPQLFAVEWGAIVVDESHESLANTSGTPTQRKNGLDRLRVRSDGLRIALSGTPWRGKAHQLWGTLNWLRPKEFTAKWRWIQTYWETGGYSGYEIGAMRPEAEPLLWDSLKPYVLRRTKPEVAKDLPPKSYVGTPYDPSDFNSPIGVWLPMGPKQEKAYRSMERESAATIEGGTLSAVGVLAELTRLKQLAATSGRMHGIDFHPALPSNKFDYIVELLSQMGIPDDPTGKVVIVSQFTKVLNAFAGALPLAAKDWTMLTGEVTGKKRQEVIDRFNEPVGSDSPHVLFLNVKAGGVAITIDSADDMVIVDEADVDAMTQVEDRIHRVSKPRPVRYHYLRSEGTVDVGTALVNAQRAALGRRLLDERRGVSYARAVLEASGVR